MEEDEATGVLSSLGLGAALGGMGLGDDESMDALRRMGLVPSTKRGSKVRAEDLENGPYADDGASDGEKYDDELEAELNRELAEEDRLAAEALAAAGNTKANQRVRGEDDDYDFDEDEQGEIGAKGEESDDLFGEESEYDPGSDAAMEGMAQPPKPSLEEQQHTDANLVRQYYPSFDPTATLNFTDLLAPPTRDSKRKKPTRGPVQSN